MKNNSVNVATLCETWFKSGSFINFPGYWLVRKDREDGRGGVAILISKSLYFEESDPLPNISNKISSTVIGIKLSQGSNLHIVSVYVQPRTRISVNEWEAFLRAIPKPYILAGDFNAHHTCWGCDIIDTSGTNLLEAVNNQNIVYLNNGNPTIVPTLNTVHKSAVDLTFCTSGLAGQLVWSLLDDPSGSDHLPILIHGQVSLEQTAVTQIRKWRIGKADWSRYSAEVTTTEIQSYESFITELNRAAELSVPKIKIRTKTGTLNNRAKSWWTEECQAAIGRRKELFTAYQTNPNLNNYLNYKKQDAVSKKVTREAKRNEWKKYCSSLSKSVPLKTVWERLNRFKNAKIPKFPPISKDQIWLPLFLQQITPDWVQIPPKEILANVAREEQVQEDDQYLLNPFTLLELNNTLKNLSNSSPGKDNIHYPMLSNLLPAAKNTLLGLFNGMWCADSDPPRDWLEYIIILVLKPNKNRGSADSYRPIALSSCVLKTYEKLIKTRLEFWLESKKLLPASQFGFRKGKDTNEAICHLVTDINLAFSKMKYLSAVFIDIKGAFDNVNLDILAKKMRDFGLPSKVICNTLKLYHERHIFIRTREGLFTPRLTSKGLPQGSILSPLLYIIYTSDLESKCQHDNNIIQFADDICLYCSSDTWTGSIQGLEPAIDSLLNWTFENGLEISAPKSMLTTFSRRRFTPPNQVAFSSLQIPYRPTVKYLGIYLDTKLTWKEQINYTAKKSENALNIIRAFCNCRWGSDPNITLLFYRSMIGSLLDYASIFYGSASETVLRKLDTLKNKCLRTCVGFMKSTPIIAMEAETVEPPLYLRRNFLSDKFLLSLQSRNSPVLIKISSLASLSLTSNYWLRKRNPLFVDSFLYISEFANIHSITDGLQCYNLKYENFNNRSLVATLPIDLSDIPAKSRNTALIAAMKKKFENYTTIFTDGSKIGACVGCALYEPHSGNSKQFKLPEEASIYTAELTAIKEALCYCQKEKRNHVVIISDCKSAIDQLRHPRISGRMNVHVRDILAIHGNLLADNKTVHLAWIRGHSGIEGNEIADTLAKQASDSGTVIQDFRVPSGDLTTKLKMKLQEGWLHHFHNSQAGSFYRSVQTVIPRKPWFSNDTNRYYIRTISRLRTNHALFGKHKYRLDLIETDQCVCGEVADLQHLFLECPILNSSSCIEELARIKNITQPFNFQHLLALQRLDIYRVLYEFSRRAGLNL